MENLMEKYELKPLSIRIPHYDRHYLATLHQLQRKCSSLKNHLHETPSIEKSITFLIKGFGRKTITPRIRGILRHIRDTANRQLLKEKKSVTFKNYMRYSFNHFIMEALSQCLNLWLMNCEKPDKHSRQVVEDRIIQLTKQFKVPKVCPSLKEIKIFPTKERYSILKDVAKAERAHSLEQYCPNYISNRRDPRFICGNRKCRQQKCKKAAVSVKYIDDVKQYGLIALKPIEEGATITVLQGILKKRSDCTDPEHTTTLSTELCMETTQFGNEARFINHSDYPNAEFVKELVGPFLTVVVKAITEIEEFQEITLSYSDNVHY